MYAMMNNTSFIIIIIALISCTILTVVLLLITCLWFLGYYIGKGDFCKAVSDLTLLSLFSLNSLSYCLCLVNIIITLFTPSHLLKPRHYIWR